MLEARRHGRAEAVLRNVRDAGSDRRARIADPQLATRNVDGPAGRRPHPRDRLRQLPLPVPRHARDTDDLATEHGERRRPSAPPRRGRRGRSGP